MVLYLTHFPNEFRLTHCNKNNTEHIEINVFIFFFFGGIRFSIIVFRIMSYKNKR